MQDTYIDKKSILKVIKDLRLQGDVTGKSGRKQRIHSLSTDNNLAIIINLFQTFAPKRTLEIGLAFGGSAVVFAKLFQLRKEAPQHQHIAIDPSQTKENLWDSIGLINLNKNGLGDFVEHVDAFSSQALPRLVQEGAKFDIIYIDGSHIFEDVFVDWFYCRQLLSDRGLILFDDATDPHVAKVIKFIKNNFKKRLIPLSLSDYQENRSKVFYKIAEFFNKTQMRAFKRIGFYEREWNTPFINF